MLTEIGLADGTKFQVPYAIHDVQDLLGGNAPKAGWVFIAEDADTPERHFNPAHVTYLLEVREREIVPLVSQ